MINLLLGAPGGGKSYEAVAFHVIPALAEGRKVITNLPLLVDQFPPEQRRLLEVRKRTRKAVPVAESEAGESRFRQLRFALREKKFNPNAFAHVEDYGIEGKHPETGLPFFSDPWRHPETGAGPLYVIDECHKPLPSKGDGTAVEVEEWFAEHRHGHCDVLLMTQSHGKMSRAIKDLVQVCYRVRKATALGFSKKYIRKVLDGVNGTVMNESVREYDPAYFKFYKSHTQSSAAGKELEAKDIVPIWKHWTFKGAALMGIIFILIVSFNDVNILKPKAKAKNNQVKRATAPVVQSNPAPPVAASAPHSDVPGGVGTGSPPVAAGGAPAVPVESKSSKAHPLAGLGLHIAGYIADHRHAMYLFLVSQNGQGVYTMNQPDFERSGYSVRHMNDCIAEVSFEAVKFYVTCDAPRISVTPSATVPKSS